MEEIWTVNTTCRSRYGEDTYRHERAYKKLSDALKYIGILSNMKTMHGYTIDVDPSEEANRYEIGFIAKRDNDGICEEETMVLEKIELKGDSEES